MVRGTLSRSRAGRRRRSCDRRLASVLELAVTTWDVRAAAVDGSDAAAACDRAAPTFLWGAWRWVCESAWRVGTGGWTEAAPTAREAPDSASCPVIIASPELEAVGDRDVHGPPLPCARRASMECARCGADWSPAGPVGLPPWVREDASFRTSDDVAYVAPAVVAAFGE